MPAAARTDLLYCCRGSADHRGNMLGSCLMVLEDSNVWFPACLSEIQDTASKLTLDTAIAADESLKQNRICVDHHPAAVQCAAWNAGH